mgnify:FL=1
MPSLSTNTVLPFTRNSTEALTISDEEGSRGGGGGGADDDVNLPKATVAKLIQGAHLAALGSRAAPTHIEHLYAELLPAEFTCAKDAKDLMTECCKGEPAVGPPLVAPS